MASLRFSSSSSSSTSRTWLRRCGRDRVLLLVCLMLTTCLCVLSLLEGFMVAAVEIVDHGSGSLSFHVLPTADVFLIQDKPDTFTAFHPTLDLVFGAQYGYLLFDIFGIADYVSGTGKFVSANRSWRDLRVKVRLHLESSTSSSDETNSIEIRRVMFTRPKWSDASLRVRWTEDMENGDLAAVAFVLPKHQVVEFDVTSVVLPLLASCDSSTASCRWLSFSLAAVKKGMIKLISKDNYKLDQRPQLVFQTSATELVSVSKHDTGVIKQDPDTPYGLHQTVDMISETHEGYLEFDIKDIVRQHYIFSTNKMKVKMLLYVDWSEDRGRKLKAQHVMLPAPLNEHTFTWRDSEGAREGAFMGIERAYSDTVVEFPLEHVLAHVMHEPNADDLLSHFQVKLTCINHAWIKVASTQHPIVDYHAKIVFFTAAASSGASVWVYILGAFGIVVAIGALIAVCYFACESMNSPASSKKKTSTGKDF